MSFLYDATSGFQYNIKDLAVPAGVKLQEYMPYISKYNTNIRSKATRINADCFQAIDIYAKGILGQSVPCSLGIDKDQVFVEYYVADTTYLVVYQSKGMFLTGLKLFNNNVIKGLKLEEEFAVVALFIAIIEVARKDEEFEIHFKKYCDYLSNKDISEIKIEETITILIDNIYQRIEHKQDIKVEAYKKLTPSFLRNNTLAAILFGEFKLFELKNDRKSIKDLKMEFSTNRMLSQIEKDMIPNIEDAMIVPDNMEDICKMIKKMEHSTFVKNLFIYGKAGTGKSTIARMIAYIFDLPYVIISCKPGMKAIDLKEKVFSNEGNKEESNKLPSYNDFIYDPAMAVYKLTNQYIPEISVKEAWEQILRTLQKSSGDFNSIPSSIIQAVKHGYVVEIQNPFLIEKSGILAGISILSNDISAIRLVNGEVIQRHPDCIMIFSENVENINGVDINSSVLSCCPVKIYKQSLSLETLAAWAIEVTGCKEYELILKMCETVKEISETLQERNIKDGCCGSRELLSWVHQYQVLGNVIQAAEYAVVAAASLNVENHDMVRDMIALRFSKEDLANE